MSKLLSPKNMVATAMKTIRIGRVYLTMMIWAMAMAVCDGEVITVGKDGASSYTTIQAAIDAAWSGDEIIVKPGTYYENIRIGAKDLILRSTDPTSSTVVAQTIIDGGKPVDPQKGTAVKINNQSAVLVLSGLTIIHGVGTYIAHPIYGVWKLWGGD